MRGRFLVLLGLILGLAGAGRTTPATAQIAGEWAFPFGTTRLEVDNRANVNDLTPPWIYTTVQANASNSLSFYGNFRNLVWEGQWYHYGGRPPLGTAFQPCVRPHGHPRRRETLIYGTFRVTFNAAENRFEGVMTRCRAQTGNPAYSQPFVGTRNNTYTEYVRPAEPPETREVPRLPFNPAPPLTPTPDQEAARDARQAERDCRTQRDHLGMSWSSGFGVHPCIYNIGDELEIVTNANQTQRPVSVILQAFHAEGGHLVHYLRREMRVGLANQGVPRAGHRYRVRLRGEVCHETTWLVRLLMSDGTETAPIGMIQTGTEMVPLFQRGCNPGSHIHAPEDYVNPEDIRRLRL